MAKVSPVNSREAAKQYLATHRIPQMFESLLSCLMLERPEDPVEFIEKKMSEIKTIGLDNVNWETFVFHLHPYRDGLRRGLIHDGSKFDKEREDEEMVNLDGDRGQTQSRASYKPDVFQLTESQ